MVTCPLCSAGIDVEEEELDEGDSLACDECGATLNVVGLSPLEIEAEDDDADDDEEEEDYSGDDEEEEDEEEKEDEW